MSEYKTVLMPIEVPIGDHCWDGRTCCEYFDNEGGHGNCRLGYRIAEDHKNHTYQKDFRCSALTGEQHE